MAQKKPTLTDEQKVLFDALTSNKPNTTEPPISSATLATTCATPHGERVDIQNNR